MIEKPIRKYLKQKDYQKHKILRRIKKRNQRRKEAASKIAERALRKKLKLPAFEGGKDEDELLIGGYVAPELVVTPEGNAFRTTESGLPAVSTGALLEAGIPIRRKSKELKNNQKLLGRDEYLAQQAAADEIAKARTDGLSEGFADLLTAGFASQMAKGGEQLQNGDYVRGAINMASPLMLGSGVVGDAARALIGAWNLADDDGVRKTWNYLQNGEYGRAALSGAGDLLNAGMLAHGVNQLDRRVNERAINELFRTLEEATKSPQITAENARWMAPEQWTAAQDAAIARGDMAEAQRLRDLHFATNAPNTVIKNVDGTPAHVYHGTFNKGWNSYDKRKFGTSTDNGMYGEGLYATSDRSYADVYARGNDADGKYIGEIKDLYVNGEHPFYVFNKKDLSPKEIANREDAAYQFGRTLKVQDDIPKPIWDEMNNSDIVIETKGAKRPNFAEIVVPRGEQIKLADAVTYDNNGVRIPLGERDNFNINDIRYGLIPIGAGLTGYGLYNSVINPTISSYNRGKDPIHIKPSKRGTFTAAAKKRGMGVLLFANKVLKNPSNYSSAMRKKALFAKNATKFKH